MASPGRPQSGGILMAVPHPHFNEVSYSFGAHSLDSFGVDVMIVTDRNGVLWRVQPCTGTMRPVTIERAQKAKRRSKK